VNVIVSGYAPADEAGIRIFDLDAAGNLTLRSEVAGVEQPSFVLPHPCHPVVYAVSEIGEGRVAVLRDGTVVATASTRGAGPCHVALDRGGRWLLVSNYTSGSLAVFPLDADGSVGTTGSQYVHFQGSSVDLDRQAGPHVHSSLPTCDGKCVLVADLGADQISTFRFEIGGVGPTATSATRPGSGPRHMAFAGDRLFVVHELDSTLGLYSYDAGTGKVEERSYVSTVPAAVDGNTAAHVAVDDGRVYVSNRGDDSIAVFDLEAALLARFPSGGRTPRHFALAGAFVVVANEDSDEVAVLDRDTGTVLDRAFARGASCVQVLA
jgi:6-phosphogluconolactonase